MGWGKDAELNHKSDKKMCLQRSEQRRLKVTHGLMSLTCLLLDEEQQRGWFFFKMPLYQKGNTFFGNAFQKISLITGSSGKTAKHFGSF